MTACRGILMLNFASLTSETITRCLFHVPLFHIMSLSAYTVHNEPDVSVTRVISVCFTAAKPSLDTR